MLLQRFKVCEPNKVQNDIVESDFGCLELALPYCYTWNKPAWQDKCILQLVYDVHADFTQHQHGCFSLHCQTYLFVWHLGHLTQLWDQL